ncbi:MAG: CIC family chloride channel protein [Mariniblastus sp.]|jgi:CIC family chloride channel protein
MRVGTRRLLLRFESLWKIVNAVDVMTERVVTLRLDDDLNFALGQFTALNVDELPVVSCEDKKIIGVLRRKETIAIYNQRRLKLQNQKDDENS